LKTDVTLVHVWAVNGEPPKKPPLQKGEFIFF
jgi:hypothetical protein